MWALFSAAALALDRTLKYKARKQDLPDLLVQGGSVELHTVENTGLAGGTFRNHPKLCRYLPGIAFALTAPALLRHFKSQHPAAKCGISLLLAGAASNIGDRLFRGSVTDMLCFPKAPGRLKKLVYNVADFMILFGGLLTLLFSCRSKGKDPSSFRQN